LVSAKFKGKPLQELLDREFTIAASCFIRQLAAPWQETWETESSLELLDINHFPFEETELRVRHQVIEAIRQLGGVSHKKGARLDGRLEFMFENAEVQP
jgi:5'-nucleotidase/UDP-sugar diphosphatase